MTTQQTPSTTTGAFGYTPEDEARLRGEFAEITARYPAGHERSALIPMLHLVQSEDGYVAPRGIALCADALGLTRSEVSAVATFYSQFRRHPAGEYHVGVCTNALCAVMGGDYAPVVMVNWEFFDNQTPASAVDLVRRLEAGEDVTPTRGPETLPTFRQNERLLAGFEDGRVDEGPGAGHASLRGLRLAREHGWTAPASVEEESK